MKATEAVERIRALRALTKATGTLTNRAQNELLKSLTDAELAEAALLLSDVFKSERGDRNEQHTR